MSEIAGHAALHLSISERRGFRTTVYNGGGERKGGYNIFVISEERENL